MISENLNTFKNVPEMPGIPDSLESFLILVIHYGITDDARKISKKNWNLLRA